ncbi:MAG: 4Fe-4S double cluster binding domain-containing protein, partial [Gaiellaceae bacterium]
PLETDQPATDRCGSCTRCLEACPTEALVAPGVLDARRCLSYLTIELRGDVPEEFHAAMGSQIYGCDICQDVCPWNRGVEKRRAGETGPADAEPHVSLVDWLEAGDEELAARYDRLFVPRNDPRYLRRNALVALGNSGGEPGPAQPYARGDEPLLREQAEWALARIGERA